MKWGGRVPGMLSRILLWEKVGETRQFNCLLLQLKTWWKISILQVLWNCKKSCRAQISVRSSFYLVGARAKKALSVAEASRTSFRPGITKWCWSAECNVLRGSYGERWSCRYVGPRPKRALKVSTKTLNQIWYTIGSQCSRGAQSGCASSQMLASAYMLWCSAQAAISGSGSRVAPHRETCSSPTWKCPWNGVLDAISAFQRKRNVHHF